MRKLKRSMLRYYAEKHGYKPSRFIRNTWHKIQNEKFGIGIAVLLRHISTATTIKNRKKMSLLSRKGVI